MHIARLNIEGKNLSSVVTLKTAAAPIISPTDASTRSMNRFGAKGFGGCSGSGHTNGSYHPAARGTGTSM